MNLKISSKQIRLRMSVSEVEELFNVRSLSESCIMPDGTQYRYGVELTPEEHGIRLECNEGIWFKVDPEKLTELYQAKPARGAGIFESYDSPAGPTQIALEIDLFTLKNKKRNNKLTG